MSENEQEADFGLKVSNNTKKASEPISQLVSSLVLFHSSLWNYTSSFSYFLHGKTESLPQTPGRICHGDGLPSAWRAARSLTKKGDHFPQGSCTGNRDYHLEGERKSHSLHPYHAFLIQTSYASACSQFPVLNYAYRNLLELLCLTSAVLQWHFSPPPFPKRRWQVTVHSTHVTSTTQSSPFNFCMLRHDPELLVMELHQCHPWKESQKRNAAMDIDASP